MPHPNIIDEKSDEEIWQVISDQLKNNDGKSDYSAQFTTSGHCVSLNIDILPIDNDEDDIKPVTSFSATLSPETSFRFSVEEQNLKHQIGKLFGMQDVIIGQPAFNKKFLIQSNDVEKVKELLSDPEVTEPLLQYSVADFQVKENKIGVTKEIVLRLDIDGGITDPAVVQKIYRPFKIVLDKVD